MKHFYFLPIIAIFFVTAGLQAQNVGIGQNTPASKLDIQGGVTVGSNYSGNDAAPSNGALFEGNVGIGTTTAPHNLDVNGEDVENNSGTWSGAIRIRDPEGDELYMDGDEIDAGIGGDATDDALYLQNNNSNDVVMVDGGGNVGIGSGANAPNHKLHVDGDAKLASGTSVNTFSTDGTLGSNSDNALPTEQAVKTYVDNNGGGDNLGNHTATTTLDMDNNDISFVDHLGFTNSGFRFNISINSNGQLTFNNDELTGGTSVFSIDDDGAGVILENGNFDATGGKVLNAYSVRSGTGTNQALRLQGKGSVNIIADNDDNSGSSASDIAFYSNGESTSNNSMIIKENGNVGIGPNSPDAQLHVGTPGDALGLNSLIVEGDDESTDIAFDVRTSDSSPASSDSKFLIQGDGNVGIGTTNPNNKLVVDGNTHLRGDHTTGKTGSSIDVAIDDDDTGLETPRDGQLNLYSDDEPLLKLHRKDPTAVSSSYPDQGLIFNDIGKNHIDFRFEGGNEDNLLYGDAGEDKVGVRTKNFATDEFGPDITIDAESFESTSNHLGDWTSSSFQNSPDWEHEDNGTVSGSTGPDGADDGTYYIHPDASDFSSGDIVWLEQTVDLSTYGYAEIGFNYHMYFDGASDGTLELLINGSQVWSISGQQQSGNSASWGFESVDLSSYAGQSNVTIRFQFTIGSNANSFDYDCSLDDINLTGVKPATFQVGQDGDGTYALANDWETWSDKRWKTDIHEIPAAIEKITSLNGYFYHWKENKQDQSEQMGVVAQEVQKQFPQVVSKGPDGYLSVSYGKLTAPLIEAVKEQQSIINKQKETIEQLRSELQSTNSSMKDLRSRVQQIENRLSERDEKDMRADNH